MAFYSCEEEETPERPDFISANVNGISWEGIPEIASIQDNDSIWLGGDSREQDWTKRLYFKIKFQGEGEYTLDKSTHHVIYFEEDMQTGLYRLDENSPSQFTITEYNSKQNIIKGNFEMTLLLKQNSDIGNNAEKLVYKNGRFKITLEEL